MRSHKNNPKSFSHTKIRAMRLNSPKPRAVISRKIKLEKDILSWCKYCQERTTHSSFTCFNRPRPMMKQESDKSRQKRLETSDKWFELNPPDEYGYWHCYLEISPNCPHRLTKATLELEHVKPKSKHAELKYDVNNLRPACGPCNYMKLSTSLEKLAETYPHLKKYLDE